MAKDYIPSKDADFEVWLTNFFTTMDDAPSTFGVTETQMTNLGTLRAAFMASKADNDAKTVTSKVATQAKNLARKNVVDYARTIKNIVDSQTTTTDAMRADLAINIADTIPTAISAPNTQPVLGLDFSIAQKVTVSATDNGAGSSKGKPFGAVGFSVWCFVGDVQPLGITGMEYLGLVSGRNKTFEFEESQRGKRIHFVAVWETKRGLRSGLGAFNSCIIP
jgi:hypothetical protein